MSRCRALSTSTSQATGLGPRASWPTPARPAPARWRNSCSRRQRREPFWRTDFRAVRLPGGRAARASRTTRNSDRDQCSRIEPQSISHIPHLQTSTIGIICSCLQPVFAPLGLYLGDQGVLFEKCSFDKEGQIDDYRLQLTNVTTLASSSYQAHHAKGPFLANLVLKVAPHGSVDDGWVELYAGPAAS